MMQTTRRRISRSAWLGLGLMVGLPSLAQAQLFPNRDIKREKQPCATEPPFYSMVRRNYFGYYPTCWSKFPDGWGCPCPNPELPNRAASFNDQPRDKFTNPSELPDDLMPGDERDPLPGEDMALPPVPNPGGRSPFGTDSPRANPGTPALPDPSVPPRNTGRPTAPTRPGVPPDLTPDTTATGRPTAPTALLELPRIDPPVMASTASGIEPNLDPGTINLVPEATLTSTDPAGRSNPGPPAAAPLPAASLPAGPELVIDPSVLAPSRPTAAPSRAQAPQRRGVLSGLFNSSKRRR